MKQSFSFSPFILLIIPVILFLLLSSGAKNAKSQESFANTKVSTTSVTKVSTGLLKFVLK